MPSLAAHIAALDKSLSELADIGRCLADAKRRVRILAKGETVPVVAIEKPRAKKAPRVWAHDVVLTTWDISKAANDIYDASDLYNVADGSVGNPFDRQSSIEFINDYYDGRKNPLPSLIAKYRDEHKMAPGDEFYHVIAIDRLLRRENILRAGDIADICGDFYARLVIPEKYVFDVADSLSDDDWADLQEEQDRHREIFGEVEDIEETGEYEIAAGSIDADVPF